MEPLNVFLSHITQEVKLADILERHINRDFLGLVRLYNPSGQTGILVGSKWLQRVTSELNLANLHVVLASPVSVRREWINFEAGAAHVRGIPIIPVCHSGLSPAQLPVPLSESEGVVLSGEDGFERFYQAVATQLNSNLPSVDYAAYGREVAAFEEEYAKRTGILDNARQITTEVETVRNPRALCISSKQFLKIGFENQLERVLAAFPSDVHHDRVFDSLAVRRALSEEHFDIVHIAAFVCPRAGTLYFSDVDLRTGRAEPNSQRDTLSPDDLGALLKGAQTKLAVVTSCNSLPLAASLISVCHVVAARDVVSSKMMAAWVEAFYNLLPSTSLSQALDYAIKASGAPMRLYARQLNSIDLRVERSVGALEE